MRIPFTIFVLTLSVTSLYAARPVVSFVRASISDSTRGVQQRAFDILLRDAVRSTKCLDYVDIALRDSQARLNLSQNKPFALPAMASQCGVSHGVYFSLDRIGYAVRLASRVVTEQGPMFERVDIDLLLGRDTANGANPYEAALRRLLGRFVSELARRTDSTCGVAGDTLLALTIGAVVIHAHERGYTQFLKDNASRVANLGVARMADTLRDDPRFTVVDIHSRDQLYARLREYDIQNTVAPTDPEISLMHGAGIGAFLVAEIDSGNGYRTLRVRVSAYATIVGELEPLVLAERECEPDMEPMLDTINSLTVEIATRASAVLRGRSSARQNH
jgi:hypothetical protein